MNSIQKQSGLCPTFAQPLFSIIFVTVAEELHSTTRSSLRLHNLASGLETLPGPDLIRLNETVVLPQWSPVVIEASRQGGIREAIAVPCDEDDTVETATAGRRGRRGTVYVHWVFQLKISCIPET